MRLSAPFDIVPRIGDLLSVGGRVWRVRDVYIVLSTKSGGRDEIYLSVDSVPIPKIFAKAQRYDVTDESD